jgi:hypothetical protein
MRWLVAASPTPDHQAGDSEQPATSRQRVNQMKSPARDGRGFLLSLRDFDECASLNPALKHWAIFKTTSLYFKSHHHFIFVRM